MITVKLEFNLANPEHKKEFMRYTKSLEMALLLEHIQSGFVFKSVVTDKDSQTYIDGVEDTLLQIKTIMKDYEINLKELI